ncbi:hypothetical protein [Embleya sp. NPDC001921]
MDGSLIPGIGSGSANDDVEREHEAAVDRRRRARTGVAAMAVGLALAFFGVLFVNGASVTVSVSASAALSTLWGVGLLAVMRVRAQRWFEGPDPARLAAMVWAPAPGATAWVLCLQVLHLAKGPSILLGSAATLGCASAYLCTVAPAVQQVQMRHGLVQPAGTRHAMAMAKACAAAIRDPRTPRLEGHFARLNHVHAQLALSFRAGDRHQQEADRMVRAEIVALRNDRDFWPLLAFELFEVFEAYAMLHADRGGFEPALAFLEHRGSGLPPVRATAAELRGDHAMDCAADERERAVRPDVPLPGTPTAPDTRRSQVQHLDSAVRFYRVALDLTDDLADMRVIRHVKHSFANCLSAVMHFELGDSGPAPTRAALDAAVARLAGLLPDRRHRWGPRPRDLPVHRLGLGNVLLLRATWGVASQQITNGEAIGDLLAAQDQMNRVIADRDAEDHHHAALAFLAEVLEALERLGHREVS